MDHSSRRINRSEGRPHSNTWSNTRGEKTTTSINDQFRVSLPEMRLSAADDIVDKFPIHPLPLV